MKRQSGEQMVADFWEKPKRHEAWGGTCLEKWTEDPSIGCESALDMLLIGFMHPYLPLDPQIYRVFLPSSAFVHLTEKAMAPYSSTLAWKIPWTEEPGRLKSMGSLRVRHDWATSLSRFTFMHWRRKWQPTPVFFPGESQGWGSLVGCRLWGRTESDTTEAT